MIKSKGKLTLITGPMFSGKTGKLIAMVQVFTNMGYKVLTIKPIIDARYSNEGEIHSHDHRTSDALVINQESAIEIVALVKHKHADKVIIDEAQFFETQTIIQVVKQLLASNFDVYVAGLLYDYRRQPFGAMPHLLGLADEHLKLFSICQKCGGIAAHSQKITGNHQEIDIGAADKYIAVCSDCYSNY